MFCNAILWFGITQNVRGTTQYQSVQSVTFIFMLGEVIA